jgi:prevent-host-death family protein
MAEQFRSITETRKELPSLSQTVQGGGDRYVITNQGKPQAVLIGYSEYKGLLAAAELLNRPKELAHLEEGLAQTQRIGFEELKENLRNKRAAQGEATPPTTEEQTAAAPLGAIDKKLDQIKGYLERIIELTAEGVPVALVDEESLRSRKGSDRVVRGKLLSGVPMKQIKVDLVEHDRVLTAEREGRRVIAAEAEMKAGR